MKTFKQNKIAIALFASIITLGLGSPAFAQGTPSTPVSDGGVTPYIIDGANPGGNRTCAEVGTAFFGDADYYEFSSDRVNYEDGTFTALFPTGLTVTTDGTKVSFDSSFGIGAAIVKGSDDANVYVYYPQVNSDSGLASPPNASGKPAGLSNLTFCWNPEDQDPQWCSPGYWRQPHHLDSWVATGISPDESYSDYFGAVQLTKKGKTDGATDNPTLLQVLQSPQWYGGDAFNKVGDLLSEAHPDVNYLGARIEDSCPLD
ncbi:hypothetical protein [Methylicorpusculum sp.]|uniref:hypothetical protein n=1 Tax=Methylicorpusculum sp. TaxID=2713644 RepID=UPI0027300C87|nr:hypothetical protein [Methylicorpusculum sp.]MDP2180006.1 hypothetical protein [Methylicorpusculum sp.]MDP3528644.1 hypothetical protein [Methylicorpusculum sp.]MDZ4151854.1 hypothetical protein [Methylicorpusculum sp.]